MVTGGAGFVGSHLVDRIVREGHEVVVYDNFTSGNRENLAGHRGRGSEIPPPPEWKLDSDDAGLTEDEDAERKTVVVRRRPVTIVEGDVRDVHKLEWYMQGVTAVFHQAAIVSVPYSIEHPQETHDVNIQGTLNVLQCARRQGVKRVVFASSAAVYGDDPELPKREDQRPTPISPYGTEKLAGEHYLSIFDRLYGVETVALRYFNVFGPRQDPRSPYSGVISIFASRVARGEAPTIFGDGLNSRDFVFVDDVVEANWLAMRTPGARGRVFNVGRGEETTLNALVAMLAKLQGKNIAAKHEPARAGDIVASRADITRIGRELGFAPGVSVSEGLRRLLAGGT